MTSHEHAQALYDEAAEQHDGSVDAFKNRLTERAQEMRQGITQATRSEVVDALEYSSPEERDEAAHVLEHAAEDVAQVFRGSSLTLKKLDEDVAGEAQLGADVIRIDPRKLSQGGAVIDVQMARDVLVHEQEHTRQSPVADADAVTIEGRTFDVSEVREAAAISVQQNINFLSAEYRSIAACLTMTADDRSLVRDGRFRELEAHKSGQHLAA